MSIFANDSDKHDEKPSLDKPGFSVTPESEGPIESSSTSQKRRRVLAILNPITSQRVSKALSSKFNITSTFDVDEGLDHLSKWSKSEKHYDLIIFNSFSGQMDLESFVERARYINDEVPILLLNGTQKITGEKEKELVNGLTFPESFLSADLLSYVTGILPRVSEQSASLTGNNLSELRKNSKILIVDDKQSLGRLCLRALTTKGYDPNNVVYVNTRPAALQLLKSREFDVILSDFNMPEMGYVEFREKAIKLVESKYKKKIWILLASGNPYNVEDTGAIADVYLVKPFDFNKMISFIDDLALKKKQERRPDEV